MTATATYFCRNRQTAKAVTQQRLFKKRLHKSALAPTVFFQYNGYLNSFKLNWGGTALQDRYKNLFPATLVFSIGLMLLGLTLEAPLDILKGLYHIVTMQDLLITDYVSIGGPGAALVNAGLVTVISICIIKFSGDPFNGFTIVEMGLMAGFSLFGKNFVNIWPIILGTWLYAKYQRDPFSRHASVALLATSLAPLVSYMSLGSIHASLPLGLVTGVLIGFILPSLSAYTYKVQNGMNLYNMGFACGLFAMMVVPILTAFGDSPDSVLYWAEGYNTGFIAVLSLLCSVLILLGFFATGVPAWSVWAGYRRLLSTTGRAPSDYLRMFGYGPVMVNIGVSAFGKHARNILPVMLGVFIGAYGMHHTPDYPSLQLAGLFGTTLAPISGHFGWPYGVLAGFIHASLVLQTGGPVAGLNQRLFRRPHRHRPLPHHHRHRPEAPPHPPERGLLRPV